MTQGFTSSRTALGDSRSPLDGFSGIYRGHTEETDRPALLDSFIRGRINISNI
jgi:hypothetical protein